MWLPDIDHPRRSLAVQASPSELIKSWLIESWLFESGLFESGLFEFGVNRDLK
ncbi:hypothetical protein [Homoserinimonas sp. OAct 916]|uniref:hypothetical protein n=1 Tax=Homoserinimonas sp. OAct 916 TaxID=2211450 RepID=UPI001300420D|nr:hypothetical protein [Homoserinimonas sp. OAct 916]